MKKWIAILLTFVMGVSLAACGGAPAEQETSEELVTGEGKGLTLNGEEVFGFLSLPDASRILGCITEKRR